MQIDVLNAESDPAFDASRSPEIVVVYEDFDTAARVKSVLARLFPGRDVSARTTFWKFDLLNYSALMVQAARDGALASYMIVSAHGHDELPGGVRQWVEGWLGQRNGRSGTLIALLDETSEGSVTASGILAYLKLAADAAHLEWIPGVDSAAKSRLASLVEEPASG